MVSKMTVLCLQSAVLLTALLVTAGSVVYGSPVHQDTILSDFSPLSWTDCSECCTIVMSICSV